MPSAWQRRSSWRGGWSGCRRGWCSLGLRGWGFSLVRDCCPRSRRRAAAWWGTCSRRCKAMHEMGMTQRLLAATLQQAAGAGARRVTAVHIVAHELAAVSADSVRFYWEMVSAGTIAEGARLTVEQQPARLVC